jgi:hypothetical protein
MKQDNPINKLLKWVKNKKEDRPYYKTPDYNIEYRIKPKESRWTKAVAISQIALAGITFATLIVYMSTSKTQSGLTREALKKTESANYLTRKALTYTKIGNDISRDAVIQSQKGSDQSYSVAKQTMENGIGISKSDLRPYICNLEVPEADTPKLGAYNPTIRVKNYGKTPAFDLNGIYYLHIDTAFDVNNFITGQGIGKFGFPLYPPGKEYDVYLAESILFINPATLYAINKSKRYLFIAVRLFYNQYFGEYIFHYTTTMCLYYNVSKKRFSDYNKFCGDKEEKKYNKKHESTPKSRIGEIS